MDKSLITQHSEIVGSCGTHVGTVDHLEGDFIKLTRADSADGKHHYLPVSVIADVQEGRLTAVVNHVAVVSLLQDTPEPGEPGSNFAASS